MSKVDEVLALRFARQHVENFNAEDDIVRQHYEAMQCYDCEAFLQLGIDAFNWLVRAVSVMRQEVYNEISEYDADFEQALKTLFQLWLEPSDFAVQWAKLQEEQGFALTNAKQFLHCCEEVKAIVASFQGEPDESVMSESLSKLRDQAIQEYRNGQTAEFI